MHSNNQPLSSHRFESASWKRPTSWSSQSTISETFRKYRLVSSRKLHRNCVLRTHAQKPQLSRHFLCVSCFASLPGTALASELPNFQSGFRRCLTNVNHFLLVDDNLNGSERLMLSQLSRKLWRTRVEEEAFSTTDSYPERAEAAEGAQRLVSSVASSEDGQAVKSEALKANDVQQPPAEKHEKPWRRTERVHPKNSSHKKFDSVGQGNEAANTLAQNMWRPW